MKTKINIVLVLVFAALGLLGVPRIRGQEVYAQTVVYEVKSVTTIKEIGGRVDWSHSGNNLIAFDKPGADGYYDVYTMNPDGSSETCLTCDKDGSVPQRHNGNPAWHPSGQYIVFQSEKSFHLGSSSWSKPGWGVNTDLWLMTSDGSAFYQLTDLPLRPLRGVLHPHFSHDGSKLLWSERIGGGGKWGTWVLKLADFVEGPPPDLDLVNIKTFQFGDEIFHESHDFSPDDTLIIFSGNLEPGQDGTGLDIYTLYHEQQSGEPTRLTETLAVWDEHAQYSPSGDKIVWMSSQGYPLDPDKPEDLISDYWLMDPDGSNKTQLTHFNQPGYPEYTAERITAADNSWAPDGTRLVALLITDGKANTGPIVIIELIELGEPTPAVNVSVSTGKSDYVDGADTVAVLTATITDENGVAVSSLSSLAFATTVDSVSTVVTFTETTTPGTYTGNLDISSLAVGPHTVAVTVTDPQGITGTGSATVNIIPPSATVTVTSITPYEVQAGTTVAVEIKGSAFALGAEVTFEGGQGPTPSASTVVVQQDTTTINADITAGAGGPKRPRVWDVRVTNPDGSTGVLEDGFTVNP